MMLLGVKLDYSVGDKVVWADNPSGGIWYVHGIRDYDSPNATVTLFRRLSELGVETFDFTAAAFRRALPSDYTNQRSPQLDPSAVAPISSPRPRWLVPVLVGGGLLAATVTAVVIARR